MSTGRRDVLWIMADKLRPQALGCHGDVNARSPRLDRVVAEGVTCEMAFANCPVCMPARAALMTGQYGHRNGLHAHGNFLPPGRRTIAHAFCEPGYRLREPERRRAKAEADSGKGTTMGERKP
jgi:arylsulfatase A-like enzyme